MPNSLVGIKPTLKHSLKFRILTIVISLYAVFAVSFSIYTIKQFNSYAILTVNHEGLLLSDILTSMIADDAASNNIVSMQRNIDRIVKTRQKNDIEINVIKLADKEHSAIVASNNAGNIDETDQEEHEALLFSLENSKPSIEIGKASIGTDAGDDPSTRNNPNHPDYYLAPGFKVIRITTPVFTNHSAWGSVNIKLSLRYLEEKEAGVYRYIAIVLSIGLVLLSVWLVLFLNRNVFNPLWDLADSIYLFGTREYRKDKLFASGKNEIGIISNEFNKMTNRIFKAEELNKQYRDHLEELVSERTKELSITQDATILSMASLAETRDNETGSHLKRTQKYIKLLAEEIKDHPQYKDTLDSKTIELICKSAPLHDIGKVGVPDNILLKPGKLTEDEFNKMKEHTTLGRDAILAAENKLGTNSFLRFAREIAYTHQEKWDGSGYPQGLKGEDIPISGRLMAIADVYDALISKRVYKPKYTHGEALEIIKEGKGTHFDPVLADAFVSIEWKIKNIADKNAD